MTEAQGNEVIGLLDSVVLALDALLDATVVGAFAVCILCGFTLWRITILGKNQRHIWCAVGALIVVGGGATAQAAEVNFIRWHTEKGPDEQGPQVEVRSVNGHWYPVEFEFDLYHEPSGNYYYWGKVEATDSGTTGYNVCVRLFGSQTIVVDYRNAHFSVHENWSGQVSDGSGGWVSYSGPMLESQNEPATGMPNIGNCDNATDPWIIGDPDAPIANFELLLDPADGCLPVLVSADASGSVEPNGASLTYDWEFVGPFGSLSASGPTPEVSISTSGGTWLVSLTVSGPGGTDTAEQYIELADTPVAGFRGNGHVDPTALELDATYDGADSYEWSVTGPDDFEASDSGQEVLINVPEAAAYRVTLTVTEGNCSQTQSKIVSFATVTGYTETGTDDEQYGTEEECCGEESACSWTEFRDRLVAWFPDLPDIGDAELEPIAFPFPEPVGVVEMDLSPDPGTPLYNLRATARTFCLAIFVWYVGGLCLAAIKG